MTSAVVPETFPLWLADLLRAEGVELAVDGLFFDERRRVKTAAELAGIRRAQRAAEAGMDAARALLRQAAQNGDGLVVDGEPLTVERVKAAMAQAFAAHGSSADDFIVAPGPQGAVGHDMGSGPIRAGVPIVIDVWPRDNETACFADMTRTFVVGDVPDDVARWHRLCRQALDARGLRHPRRRRRPGDLRRDVRHLRGGRGADAADEGSRPAARRRVLPRARARRRARGARAARPGAHRQERAQGRRRRHRRAGSATGRGSAACGSRISCS